MTAVSVLGVLDPARYEVSAVGITRAGEWVTVDIPEGPGGLGESLQPVGRPVEPFAAVSPGGRGGGGRGGRGGGRGGGGGAGGGGGSPVVVLPLLHGPFGEDGTVQGLCELAGVPYVGSGVLGSAVCMDKVLAKRLLREAGLPVARGFGLREDEVAVPSTGEGDDRRLAARVEAELGWPVFVKPANLGSSVGVSKVPEPAGLAGALARALAYDEWVVVEEAVAGREIECAVLGDRPPMASVPGEVVPSHEFYDFEDKYVDGAAKLLVPAPLHEAVVAEVQRLACLVFGALRAEGMARVDFFYDEGGRGLVVNEANTIPGFTPISMYPKLWEASGVPYPALLDRLIALAVERHARRSVRVGRSRSG